ncbi:hypothetical protein RUM43_009741 [Polyplax serrata]|uniref:Uncharacterized protein n=1 Tax=Polyplax serrata TaxID=468196 RepID=A0AAN8P6K3_POLSC
MKDRRLERVGSRHRATSFQSAKWDGSRNVDKLKDSWYQPEKHAVDSISNLKSPEESKEREAGCLKLNIKTKFYDYGNLTAANSSRVNDNKNQMSELEGDDDDDERSVANRFLIVDIIRLL